MFCEITAISSTDGTLIIIVVIKVTRSVTICTQNTELCSNCTDKRVIYSYYGHLCV